MDSLIQITLFVLYSLLITSDMSFGQHPTTITNNNNHSTETQELSPPTFVPQNVQSPELLEELSRIRNHFQTLTNSEKLIAVDAITSKLKLAPNFVAQLLYKTPLPLPLPVAVSSTPIEASPASPINNTTTNTNNNNSEENNLSSNLNSSGNDQTANTTERTKIINNSNNSNNSESTTPKITIFSVANTNLTTGPSTSSSSSLHSNGNGNGSTNTTAVSSNLTESKSVTQNQNQNPSISSILNIPPSAPSGKTHSDHRPTPSDTNIEDGFGALQLEDAESISSNGGFNGTQEEEGTDDQDSYWKDKIGKLITDIGERCDIIYC